MSVYDFKLSVYHTRDSGNFEAMGGSFVFKTPEIMGDGNEYIQYLLSYQSIFDCYNYIKCLIDIVFC